MAVTPFARTSAPALLAVLAAAWPWCSHATRYTPSESQAAAAAAAAAASAGGEGAPEPSPLGLVPGGVLMERFHLEEHLGSEDLGSLDLEGQEQLDQASNVSWMNKLAFPTLTSVKTDSQSRKALGAGSFGESWMVTDMDPKSKTYQKQVVIKLLYIKEGNRPAFLTWAKAGRNAVIKEAVQEAARECQIARRLHLAAGSAGGKGAQRVMNCYGSNIPDGSSSKQFSSTEPLYLLLENCGADDLTKFMSKHAKAGTLTADLVINVFKQIVEGLDFLASLSPPWIHHDLKPDNIVVKTQKNALPSVHLIDFGATVRVTQSTVCAMTAATPVFSPKELGQPCPTNRLKHKNFDVSCGDRCAVAFDIFSAGAIFAQLVSGKYLYEFTGFVGRQGLNYGEIQKKAGGRASAWKNLVKPATGYSSLFASFFSDSKNHAVLESAIKMLSTRPGDRPTATSLLRDLSGVETPDDQDFVAGGGSAPPTAPLRPSPPVETPPQVVRPVVEQPLPAAPQQPAKRPEAPAAAAAAAAKACPYKVGDLVQVFSVPVKAYEKKKVVEVLDGAVLRLSPGGTLIKCDSTRLRRYNMSPYNAAPINKPKAPVAGGQLPVAPEGGAAVAGGAEDITMLSAAPPDPSVDASAAQAVKDGSKCPRECTRCSAAFYDNGQRRVKQGKPLVFCYVKALPKQRIPGCDQTFRQVVLNRDHWYKYTCVDQAAAGK